MAGRDEIESIGELARAERALLESEQRFRLIADSAPVPMWVTSLDRTRWFVNRAYVDFVGVPYDEAIGFDWRTILHPEDQPRILKEQTEKEAALQPFALEARYRKPDGGGWCWLRSYSQPRWGPDGEHLGFIGVAFDISIAKEAEQELQKQVAARTAELEALYNKTPTILHSAGPDQSLISVSDRWLEFMGYESREQVLGRKLGEFMTAESVAHLRETTWPQLLATGAIDNAEYQIIKSNGELADVVASTRLWYDDEGRFVRTVAALTDVTSKKRTEEALRQAQKVEAMGQLTGGVAHDFNNLLSPIIGGLDVLQRRRTGDDRDQRTIAGAMQAAERAKTLVQRLLAFARRQPLRPAPIDAGELIRGMAELIASTAGPRIQVKVEIDRELPTCLADPNQVEMALLNLSVNARDAMPEGGVLIIRAAGADVNEPASDLRSGRYVRLSVADTGCGMDEGTRARAIEPFFSTKGVGKGTGLGLSMAHGLAAQLGGALRLRSEPGRGTDVELWLPCSEENIPAARQTKQLAEDRRVGRVVLIDDEELVRASTEEMLQDMGYQVTAFETADQALAHLQSNGAPDLLITDHLMPGVTGAELAPLVRQSWPDVQILIISGYAETLEGAAPVAHLTKPFRQVELAAAIAALTS